MPNPLLARLKNMGTESDPQWVRDVRDRVNTWLGGMVSSPFLLARSAAQQAAGLEDVPDPLVDPNVEALLRSRQLAERGETGASLGWSAAAGVPVVGPPVAAAIQDIAQGQVAGGTTDLFLQALPFVLGGLARRAAPTEASVARPYELTAPQLPLSALKTYWKQLKTPLALPSGTGPRPIPAEALEALPPVPYNYRPTEGTRVSGIYYHGTPRRLNDIREADPAQYGSPVAAYGPGLYLTDNPNVAAGYRGRSMSGGQVLSTRLENVRTLDLEKPLPPHVYDIFDREYFQLGEGKHLPRDVTGTGAFRLLNEASAMTDLRTASDHMGMMLDLANEINQLGYDALRYQGGRLTRGTPHNVLVLLPDLYQSGTKYPLK